MAQPQVHTHIWKGLLSPSLNPPPILTHLCASWWLTTLRIEPKLVFFLLNPCQHGGHPMVALT